MRIFIASEEFPPLTGWGGIATYSHTLARALAKRGEEVTVFTRAESDREEIEFQEGFRLIRLPCHRLENDALKFLPHFIASRIVAPLDEFTQERLAFIAAFRKKTLELCRTEGAPEIVETPDWGASGLALVGGDAKPIKYLVHLHSPALFVDEANQLYLKSKLKAISLFEALAIKRAQMVVSPTRYLAERAIKTYRLDFKKVNVIPHPFDAAFFEEPVEIPQIEASKRPYIFCAGRYERRKGQTILIEAFAKIAAEFPELNLLFAGSDTPTGPGETSYETAMYKAIAANRLNGRVVMLPNQDRAGIRALLRGALIFALPSIYENAPYAILEAQACGAPIAAFDVGGVGEYITHNEDGLLVPGKNVISLAYALKRLITDAELRTRLSARSRSRARETLEPARIAKMTVELYQQVVYS